MADVIWTVDFSPAIVERASAGADVAATVDAILDQGRFSFVSPAAERLFQYTLEEIASLSVRDIMTPAALARVREVMIEEFSRGVGDAGAALAATVPRIGVSGQGRDPALVRSCHDLFAERSWNADGRPGNHP